MTERDTISKSSVDRASCPICGALVSAKYRPFCSKRCADVDLHRWLNDAYAIPAVEDDGNADPDAGA